MSIRQKKNRWQANLTRGGRRCYIGSFMTKEDAENAIANAIIWYDGIDGRRHPWRKWAIKENGRLLNDAFRHSRNEWSEWAEKKYWNLQRRRKTQGRKVESLPSWSKWATKAAYRMSAMRCMGKYSEWERWAYKKKARFA